MFCFSEVVSIDENISTGGRDVQLALLLPAKWRDEIEKAVDKIKLGIVPVRVRTKEQRWWRKQYYRAQMRDRKRDRRLSHSRVADARL